MASGIIDYKFRQVIRTGAGTIAHVAIYEGAFVDVVNPDTQQLVSEYRRSRVLQLLELTFPGDLSDDELRKFCNEKLADLQPDYPDHGVLPEQELKDAASVRPTSERVK